MIDFCSSNVLWYMHGNVGSDGYVRVSSTDIATEFQVDESVASEQLRLLFDAEFVREVEKDTYVLTEFGQAECAFLTYFVNQASHRKVNPRVAVKIASRLREMYPGVPLENIRREFAQIQANSLGKKLKCTDEEFDLAKRLLQD